MLGTASTQTELLDTDATCGHLVASDSIHRKLAEVGEALFTDQDFADCYDPRRGRLSVPPSLLAKVQLLQSLEGVSDRQAVDNVRCDIRWKVALNLPLTHEGFHPTVLVYFRERVRTSERPRRIFDRFKEVATEAGLLTRRGTRVLDSTPVLSAVQTQDTVSMIRSGVRRVLKALDAADPERARRVRERLSRDDYDDLAKPAIDWDDEAARMGLVDDLVRDATSALAALEGASLEPAVAEAAELLATVAGQDVEEVPDGSFRIRRGVARDRVISTVDQQARHGRKSASGPFDGYKAHLAVEPDSELITEVAVTPANVHDSAVVLDLLPELAPPAEPEVEEAPAEEPPVDPAADRASEDEALVVVADAAYGSAETRRALLDTGATTVIKAPPERNSAGGFPKSAFTIDLEQLTVRCPAGVVTTVGDAEITAKVIRFRFPAPTCAACPLRARCTSSENGRTVSVGPHEGLLAEARAEQRTEAFKRVYNGKRPTVERVISRFVRNGGRKARYRGRQKVEAQAIAKSAAENLVRMFRLGLTWSGEAWAVA